MKDILILNPAKRLSTIEALRHPYFKGLNDEFLENKITRKNSGRKQQELKNGSRVRAGSSNDHASKNFIVRK